MSYKGYANQVEFIKKEFGNFYVDHGPENGILQGMKYEGAATHARNCLRTLVKMLKPKNILEIGSLHYEASDAMAGAMDDLYGPNLGGVVDTFDIKMGGYTGDIQLTPKNKRVRPGYWYPHKTDYDGWKLTDPGIVFSDFKLLTPEEIRKRNLAILAGRVKGFEAYDLIFVDGDHSYRGAYEDFYAALQVSHDDTVIVLDNVWDVRLREVRNFYNDLPNIKWDFEEWNDAHYKDNMVMDNAVILTY